MEEALVEEALARLAALEREALARLAALEREALALAVRPLVHTDMPQAVLQARLACRTGIRKDIAEGSGANDARTSAPIRQPDPTARIPNPQ